ncbi:MAG: hypothetical protein A2Y40_10415 [Candidatus Margulisbacteria bacterium GWF2_35_9]|nr:MAG: hypothetical protein A2Y40_10415 [Candidatus Margulisbacteria bacterium GWF2_35_9]
MTTNAELLNKLLPDKDLFSSDIFSLLSLKDLNREVIYKTKLLKELLKKIKKELDAFDQSRHKLKGKKELVDKTISTYQAEIDSSFFFIWNIIHLLPSEQMVIYQAYFQQQLHALFDGSPYNKRLFDKPLGYPDDYQMLLYVSDNHYLGKSTYDKFIHQYSMLIPLNASKRNRKEFFKTLITSTVIKNPKAEITCLDGGPSVDILELLKESDALTNVNLTCLNSEPAALAYVKKQLKTSRRLQKKENKFLKLSDYNLSDVVQNDNLKLIIEKQDLIYSGCLLDYFDDRMAKKIILILVERLKPNGVLVLGSINKGNKHKAYSELLGGMYIHYRDNLSLMKLTDKLPSVTNISILFSEMNDLNIFLKIIK